ncbi:hypothetical protein ScPMuIL_001912 [Solemya velum]
MPRSSRNRESNPRRSRSSGSRSRSGHRHSRDHSDHNGHRHRSRMKRKEKNFWAAVCSLVVILIICTALAEPRWFHLSGGGCKMQHNATPMKTLGVPQFFYMGHFLNYDDGGDKIVTVYQYGQYSDDVMFNCVTHRSVVLMKLIIMLCFVAILCSLSQFLLDIFGPMKRSLKIVHRNGLCSIFTVVICVIINLLCYWFTVEVLPLQKSTKDFRGSKVQITFDISFYLIAAAGSVGVLATATNCLRRYPVHNESHLSTDNLLDDYDGLDTVIPVGQDVAPMSQLPPPPAYTP